MNSLSHTTQTTHQVTPHAGNPHVAFGSHTCTRRSARYMTVFILIAAECLLPVSAGTYYVATNGVDAVGRGSEAEPFETIQYAIDKAESDSTIWVKPGVYDKGWATNRLSNGAVHTNRVSLTKKIHLKATANAAVTHIVGAPDPNTGGVGPAAIRCVVSPNGDSKDSTITGFTLRDGYGDDGSTGHNHRGGGFLQADGNKWIYISDCVISNCVACSHGGARGGTFSRCLFANNRSSPNHGSSYATVAGYANLVNCVIVGNGDSESDFAISDSSTLVNCSVVCNRGRGASNTTVLRNSIVTFSSNGDYTGTSAQHSVFGGHGILSPLEYDWRVVSGSAADGAGDPSYLSSSIPFTVVSGMTDTDFAGNPIDTSGASVNAGAVQATAPVTGGVLWLNGPLAYNGIGVPDGISTYAQSTNGLTQWRVDFAGSKVSGVATNYLRSVSRTSPTETVTLFPAVDDSLVMMVPPKAGLITTNTPQYSKALWVDPVGGNDALNSGSEDRPFSTIQKAVDEGGSRTVIFLAPGLYNAGGVSSESVSVAPYGSCRVWITNDYVRIVGKSGAENTIISGTPDSITAGFGDGAVRCVGGSGSYIVVQGVALSNGWTRAETTQSGRGAAVREITLTDSIVTCCHGYDSVAYIADLYRCRIYGNEAQNNSILSTINYSRPVRAVCSWFGENTSRSSLYYGYIGSECEAWFSTLVIVNGQSAFSKNGTKIYNSLAVGGQYVSSDMISAGNLFWNFSNVDAAAVGSFTDKNPRMRRDGIHVSSTSPALAAGIAPSAAGFDSADPISTLWQTYCSADVEGNLVRFNGDGTAMVGAAQAPVCVRTAFTVSFK